MYIVIHKYLALIPACAFPVMTWYLKIQWILYNIASCYAPGITLLFWTFLKSRKCWFYMYFLTQNTWNRDALLFDMKNSQHECSVSFGS